MPPKKQAKSEPNKKTQEKKKEKVIEDKTFGLKNKKGKKQQQFIKQVTQQVKYGGHQSTQKLETLQHEAKKKKLSELEKKKEMDSLFKPVATSQKVSAGADPKSVLCVFFRQGMCSKGDKCKFSHDLNLEGKAEKRSVYVDTRDLEQDTIDKWDEDKLKEVVEKKHGQINKPKTDIVCKYFLQAIEDGKYGWFWECPNGGDKCMYRHCLPPGFVFKTKKKPGDDIDELDDQITMEQLVEEERQKLLSSGKVLTKVTLDSFLAWKKRKLKEKRDKLEQETSKKKEALKAGRTVGISGREMFEFNPELIEGDNDNVDDDEEAVVILRREEEEDESGATAIDLTIIDMFNDTAVMPLLSTTSNEEGATGGDFVGAVGGADVEIDEQLFSEEVAVDEDLFDIDEDEQLVLEEQLLTNHLNDMKVGDMEDNDEGQSDRESVE